MTSVNTMKSEITVFMDMKTGFMGFFNTFSLDFHEKEIHSTCALCFGINLITVQTGEEIGRNGPV